MSRIAHGNERSRFDSISVHEEDSDDHFFKQQTPRRTNSASSDEHDLEEPTSPLSSSDVFARQQNTLFKLLLHDENLLISRGHFLEESINRSIEMMENECEGIETMVNCFDEIVSASNMKRAQEIKFNQTHRSQVPNEEKMDEMYDELKAIENRIKVKQNALQKMHDDILVPKVTNVE